MRNRLSKVEQDGLMFEVLTRKAIASVGKEYCVGVLNLAVTASHRQEDMRGMQSQHEEIRVTVLQRQQVDKI